MVVVRRGGDGTALALLGLALVVASDILGLMVRPRWNPRCLSIAIGGLAFKYHHLEFTYRLTIPLVQNLPLTLI